MILGLLDAADAFWRAILASVSMIFVIAGSAGGAAADDEDMTAAKAPGGGLPGGVVEASAGTKSCSRRVRSCLICPSNSEDAAVRWDNRGLWLVAGRRE